MSADVRMGDSYTVLATMPDNSVDSIVTDPPYGLSFMGKKWDYDVPSVDVWRECLRVLKPGGHLLAFAGTRTQHRMAVRIEDAGFEIRDMIAWIYGSGFPKSLDVSKAIDKMDASEEQTRRRYRFTEWVRSTGVTTRQIDEATGTNMGGHYATAVSQPSIMTREHLDACRHLFGVVPEWVEREADIRSVESANMAAREVVGQRTTGIGTGNGSTPIMSDRNRDITAPATALAHQWQGWGTALKPALETVTLASKPFPPDVERDTIIANLSTLEARLWLLSFASAADQNSTSSPSGYAEACAIARWTADEVTNTRAALSGQMDTSLFVSALNISLSIVSSWRHTLAEVWRHGSTSTTETKSSTTIDLKTLRFSLSEITPSTIIRACSLPGGFSANASTAESHFNASLSLLQSIHTLSATAPAMSLGQHERRAVPVSPNLDPCIMARKPLIGTVAENVTTWGTGAINVDGGRVGTTKDVPTSAGRSLNDLGVGWGLKALDQMVNANNPNIGRFPANLIHDGSDEVVGLFPSDRPGMSGGGDGRRDSSMFGVGGVSKPEHFRNDSGSAARFFYCAKASAEDRDDGCHTLPPKTAGEATGGRAEGSAGLDSPRAGAGRTREASGNHHPTVKPTDLMRYLCRLVTPPGGTVLDPFVGSGSTGRGAILEGFEFIGVEREAEYVEIARARIAAAVAQRKKETAQLDMFS